MHSYTKGKFFMSIRDASFFKKCEDKVISLAESAFKKNTLEMRDDGIAKALIRMKRELEIIINNGFSYEFYLLKVIVEHALFKNKLIVISGQISYSYIAYLLGISTIDPLERNYEVEMLLGFQHDRNPSMLIYAASDYKDSLIEFLKGIFGKDMISADDLSIILGKQTDNYDYMSIGFIESGLVKLSEGIIPAGISNPQSTFAEVKSRIFCSHYPSGKIPRENIVSVIKMLLWLINNEEQDPSDKLECFAIFDGTYEGLLQGLAAIHGTGIVGTELRDSDNNRILTRDDFYRLGVSLFGNEKDAYYFMTQIRKGRGSDSRYQDILENYGVPYDIRNKLKSVHYTVSEGSLISEAQLILYTGSMLFNS